MIIVAQLPHPDPHPRSQGEGWGEGAFPDINAQSCYDFRCVPSFETVSETYGYSRYALSRQKIPLPADAALRRLELQMSAKGRKDETIIS